MSEKLSVNNHSRESAGLTYIYPVLSRRAGGLSIGVNVNTNNACNWRCIYCQVPGLTRGSAPEPNLDLLEQELRFFLHDVLHGDFFQRFQMPDKNRAIKDIALSGNGEPTSVKHFARAIRLIGQIATEMGVFPASRFVLITNGSLIHQQGVQEGLQVLNDYGGEVWFKFDSATDEGRQTINHAAQNVKNALANLRLSASLCTTKLQICLLDDGRANFIKLERTALLTLLAQIKADIPVEDVLLYTIARQSMQPEASLLTKVDEPTLNQFADAIRALGYRVSVSV